MKKQRFTRKRKIGGNSTKLKELIELTFRLVYFNDLPHSKKVEWGNYSNEEERREAFESNKLLRHKMDIKDFPTIKVIKTYNMEEYFEKYPIEITKIVDELNLSFNYKGYAFQMFPNNIFDLKFVKNLDIKIKKKLMDAEDIFLSSLFLHKLFPEGSDYINNILSEIYNIEDDE